MSYKALFSTLLAAIFFTCCTSEKKTVYVFPDSFPQEKRKELLDQCKKGRELFKVNCSECHGIFTSGKDKIPNFTDQQIDNYSAKFLRHDPRNHAVTKKMSPEQLNEVLMFLRYRKTDATKSKRVLHS